MNRKRALGIGAIGLAAALTFYFVNRQQETDRPIDFEDASSSSDSGPIAQVETPEEPEVQVEPSVPSSTTPTANVPRPSDVSITEQKARLAEYAMLQRKVFLTEREKEDRRRMITDERFVRGLGLILRGPLDEGVTSQLQNQAVDLLLESRQLTKSDASFEVLSSVIQDKTIEDVSVPLPTREVLAGVKAEVLYRWSAQEDGVSQQVSGWLPGPASEMIWKNVLEEQAKNVAESMSEKRQ